MHVTAAKLRGRETSPRLELTNCAMHFITFCTVSLEISNLRGPISKLCSLEISNLRGAISKLRKLRGTYTSGCVDTHNVYTSIREHVYVYMTIRECVSVCACMRACVCRTYT